MIKNIIFDMGNVLIKYDPTLFVNRLNLDKESSELLLKAVFQSKEWLLLDEGKLTDQEAIDIMKADLPADLKAYVCSLVLTWDQPLIEIEGMTQIVADLKKAGYHIYLLSNASRRQHEYWPRISSSSLFDGTLISADIQLIKPNPEIYHHLFEKFQLQPETCYFIDDSPANIEAGEELGMAGYVFDGDADKLRQVLSQVLSE